MNAIEDKAMPEVMSIANGKNGADADVWTIGEKDGYWYKNGVKTEYKAVGVDGAPGAAGPE